MSLWRETIPLIQLAIDHQRTLRARHIPGKMNVIADQLSRSGQVLPTEWSLQPQTVQWVFQQLGSPNVDLFATKFNHKLETYFSPVPDEQALETDAKSIIWEGMFAYAYPPHQLIPRVLEKFRLTQNCHMILIAPLWQNQVWFPELLRMSRSESLKLPVCRTMLKQPQSNMFHQNPGFLNLHAWVVQKEL